MVKITRVGEEPPLEPQCPRGCGYLRYGRSLEYTRKTTNCKKCKGLMMSLDEIQDLEKKRFSKLKRNKLIDSLTSGKLGNLNCPKCSQKMVEIHMDYKKGRMTSRMEDTMIGGPKKMAGEMALEMIPIVGGIIQFVRVAADLGADIAHGKLKKSVTIDACSTCFIFWLDRGEIIQITANDLTAKNENSSVKVAPPNTQPTQGVVTASKSKVE